MGILWEVSLVVLLLCFAVWELRSVRRSIRADRDAAASRARRPGDGGPEDGRSG